MRIPLELKPPHPCPCSRALVGARELGCLTASCPPREPSVLGGWHTLLGGRAAPRTCWLLAPHSTGQRSPGTAAASPSSLQWLLEPGTCFKVGGFGAGSPGCGDPTPLGEGGWQQEVWGLQKGLVESGCVLALGCEPVPREEIPSLQWLTAIPGSWGSNHLGWNNQTPSDVGEKKILQVLGTQQNSPGEW